MYIHLETRCFDATVKVNPMVIKIVVGAYLALTAVALLCTSNRSMYIMCILMYLVLTAAVLLALFTPFKYEVLKEKPAKKTSRAGVQTSLNKPMVKIPMPTQPTQPTKVSDEIMNAPMVKPNMPNAPVHMEYTQPSQPAPTQQQIPEANPQLSDMYVEEEEGEVEEPDIPMATDSSQELKADEFVAEMLRRKKEKEGNKQ